MVVLQRFSPSLARVEANRFSSASAWPSIKSRLLRWFAAVLLRVLCSKVPLLARLKVLFLLVFHEGYSLVRYSLSTNFVVSLALYLLFLKNLSTSKPVFLVLNI